MVQRPGREKENRSSCTLASGFVRKKKEKYVRKRNTDVASDYSTDLAAKGFASEIRDGKSFPNKSFY